jgi:hypothetical protein
MRKIKAYFKLIEWFGLLNAIRLILICRSDKWQLFNYWQYSKAKPIDSIGWITEYEWHIPMKSDFEEVESFIKKFPY